MSTSWAVVLIAISSMAGGVALQLLLVGRFIEKQNGINHKVHEQGKELAKLATKLNHLDKKVAFYTGDMNGGGAN